MTWKKQKHEAVIP